MDLKIQTKVLHNITKWRCPDFLYKSSYFKPSCKLIQRLGYLLILPTSLCKFPPFGLSWCTTLHCRADFGTKIHAFLPAFFRACHRADQCHPCSIECITQISQTQCPAAVPAELLSASTAKQPEGPESQEQPHHKTQQPLCDLLQLFRAGEIQGL